MIAAAGCMLAGAASSQAKGTLRSNDGKVLTGSLEVGEDGFARITTETDTVRLEVAELSSFVRTDAEPRKVEVDSRIWLRSGQELPVKKLTGRPATETSPAVVVAQLPSGIKVELPLSMLRAIRQGGLMRPQPTLFADDLKDPPSNDDLIYVVRDGKSRRSAVKVAGLSDTTIDFELRGDEYDFSLKGLAAVVFGANTGFPPDRQPRPRTTVQLTTGERIEGKLLSLSDRIRCRLDEGFVVEIPIRNLHKLEIASDKLVWLSELTPKVVQTPAFDRVWPWHVDRTVAGPGFDLSGRHYDRGIGLVPHAQLTYDLGGRFDIFEATIGIDDRGGPEAHAIFRVLVDGKQAFESEPMMRGMKPKDLRVALNKASSLVIEVDFGKNYDLGDFCAFADARVVQQ